MNYTYINREEIRWPLSNGTIKITRADVTNVLTVVQSRTVVRQYVMTREKQGVHHHRPRTISQYMNHYKEHVSIQYIIIRTWKPEKKKAFCQLPYNKKWIHKANKRREHNPIHGELEGKKMVNIPIMRTSADYLLAAIRHKDGNVISYFCLCWFFY